MVTDERGLSAPHGRATVCGHAVTVMIYRGTEYCSENCRTNPEGENDEH